MAAELAGISADRSACLAGYEAEITGFVRRRVPACEADDVVQDVMVRAVEKLDQLRDPSRARAWLYRIARNVIADVHRAKGTGPKLMPATWWEQDQRNSSDPRDTADSCACSVHLVHSLPPAQRDMLTLVDLEGATLTEAAAELDITTNNATVRLHRARKSLRQRLQQHCGVSDARACLSCACLDAGCCPA